MSVVGMLFACATPLLMTHTGSAPSSSASCMYSNRPSPAAIRVEAPNKFFQGWYATQTATNALTVELFVAE